MKSSATESEASLANRYELLAELAKGNFGTVYKARQRSTGQFVALKLLRATEPRPSEAADRRPAGVSRETLLSAKLHHPNIVSLLDAGSTNEGDYYSVSSLVAGETLASLLSRQGALSPSEAKHLMLQVLDALCCAHEQGVVHRDLKPSNIMISNTGARPNALVLDFGIGSLVESSSGAAALGDATTRDASGTPGYGAPEQWRGAEPAPTADLFSWGVVFLECLTGRPTFPADSGGGAVYQQLGPEPVALPAVLERHGLGALLRAATQKDVTRRASTARELFALLDACEMRDLSSEELSSQADVVGFARDRAAEFGSRTADGTKSELIGRNRELELLEERWHRVREGAGQCCLVVGEPGIGKSRLASELFTRLESDATCLLEARCAPDSQSTSLFPIIELLSGFLGLEQEPTTAGKVLRLEIELTRRGLPLVEAMPLLASLLSLETSYAPLDVSAQRQKELTLSAIVSLLLTSSDEAPRLLLIEDLHWADPTTLALLDQLLRELPTARVLALFTARPEFTPLFATAGLLQLHLNRLNRKQTEGMTRELLGNKTPRPEVVEQIVSRTDGIPLFVEELVRTMCESDLLVESDGQFELRSTGSPLPIPSSLRAWLSVRLERLGRARDTAQFAAALGREFNVALLSAASPLGPNAVAEDLERLIGAGLMLRRRHLNEVSCTFKHALVRDAAYESLSDAARQHTHARIAKAIEESFQPLVQARPELLAYHHAAAEQWAQAIPPAQQAARQALLRCAYQEAAQHASQAIKWGASLPADAQVEVELEANGVLAQSMTALSGWADPRVREVADRSGELLHRLDRRSPHRVSTLWSLFAYHHTTSHRRDARAVAEELVLVAQASGDSGFRAAAFAMRGIASQPVGDIRGTERDLAQAVELYDRALHRDHGLRFGMDSLVLAKALLAYPQWMTGDTARALALVSEAIDWGRQLGHAPSLAIGLLYGCHIHQYEGDKAAVAAMSAEIVAIAAKYGLPAYEGYAAIFQAWASGDAQRGQALVRTLGALGAKLCLSYYGALSADTLAEQGALEEAMAGFDDCLAQCAENDEHYYEPELLRRKALLLLARTPADEQGARAALETAIATARAQHASRLEGMATRLLVDRFGDGVPHRTRLDELLGQGPAPQ
ncbi:MAG TPA: AAA family ATPase [Polyangiaceae bacterium]|nr:AAA family ATPase [Polyangiaceae bacterium]